MAAIIEKLSDSRAEAREWELRCDMAAVFRIGARLGWNEHIGNHNSLMLPDEAEPRFLINPRGYLFQELKASDLIVCDRVRNCFCYVMPGVTFLFTFNNDVFTGIICSIFFS